MNAKALLIPIAAFALSATGVSAFNSEVLKEAGLTQDQISAFETARDLRKEGDLNAARDVLKDAGIDLKAMEAMRKAMHAHKNEVRTAIDAAVADDDYEGFIEAIEDSPLRDIVISKDDFELFKDAHRLHKEGEHERVKKIMDELGFRPQDTGHAFGYVEHESSAS